MEVINFIKENYEFLSILLKSFGSIVLSLIWFIGFKKKRFIKCASKAADKVISDVMSCNKEVEK